MNFGIRVKLPGKFGNIPNMTIVKQKHSFWKGRKVFLTGHTGFKGSWLARWLYIAGAEVVGYSLDAPSQVCLFESAGVESFVEHNHGDIRNRERVSELMKKFQPEIVFHLAAQPLVRLSYEQPEETFSSNVMGTLSVLQAASMSGVKAFVNVTTDKCYENKEWIWAYRENEPLGGHDPYSASKACAEILTNSFRLSFLHDDNSMRLASVRAGNVIGGGDWGADRLVPDVMKAFGQKKTVHIRNPHAIRPWQHVLDALSGYMTLGEKLLSDDGRCYCDAWNFGPDIGSQQTVGVLVSKLQALWGVEASVDLAKNVTGVHEAQHLSLDSTKARTRLYWQPQWNFDTVLDRTAEWYREFNLQSSIGSKPEVASVQALMDAQIENYAHLQEIS